MSSSSYWCELAWLGGTEPEAAVLVDVTDEQITAVRIGVRPDEVDGSTTTRLAGLTIPGLADCHSHAFHRALRGRTQRERGTFWTWRHQMYDLAGRLDPDGYHRLARAVYREMAAAGITTVGEFHYLHHDPAGTAYEEPNVFGEALMAAADDAGIRITLLDTCYLAAGIDSAPEGVQVRFSDGDADAWGARVSSLDDRSHARIGAAIHSVRAVPRDQLPTVAGYARDRAMPLHVHVSEQRAENAACLAAYGTTPVGLLHAAGALDPRTSLVHATHLSDDDIDAIGRAGSSSCFCPTTERDLGDGIGPSRALHQAGSPLTVGSDSHAVIDLFEEMRAVELDERLRTEERGHWSAVGLLTAGTAHGHESLGWSGTGRIAVDAAADLVTVGLDTVRTAGTGGSLESVVFAATAADVTHVVSRGRVVDLDGVGSELAAVIEELWSR